MDNHETIDTIRSGIFTASYNCVCKKCGKYFEAYVAGTIDIDGNFVLSPAVSVAGKTFRCSGCSTEYDIEPVNKFINTCKRSY